MSNPTAYLLTAVLSIAAGILFLGYLVASPGKMSWMLALLTATLILLFVITLRYFKGMQILISVGLFISLFVLSYLLATRIYLAQSEVRQLPEISRAIGDTADGHMAVLYYTHGEPPAYSPIPWIETFHELDSDKATFIPWPFRPFFLRGVRQYYLDSGGSPHNLVHKIMIHSLMFSMPEALQQDVHFYQAFLDNPPRPDEMVIQAINEGASKLIVVPVFLTDSSHTIAGREMIEAIEPEKYGIEVCYAKTLWDTEALQQMFVERTNTHLGDTDKSRAGILLVGHGQPEDWDAIYPTQTEQEVAFRIQVRQRLIEDGYSPEQIVLAWMEFKKPDVHDGVQELLAQGVDHILYFSASISADAIHSIIQVPNEMESANVPPGVKLTNLGAWGNSPLVIEAIRQRILECEPTLSAASLPNQ
jgi:protoheme ferro-lyase